MPIAFLSRELQIVCARKSWIAFGAGKHFRYNAAHELAAALSGDKAKKHLLSSMPLQDVIQRHPLQFRKSAWKTWSNFPQVKCILKSVFTSAELSESCLAAIEHFVVLRYMTEQKQASLGL